MREVDVIVLGSGISGCISATLLTQKGYRVAMVSRDTAATYHLPESWVYSSLEFLELGEKLQSCLQRYNRCFFTSADGKCRLEFTLQDDHQSFQNGDLVWVDRNRFDKALLETALDSGVEFFPESRIINCNISSQEACLSIESQNKQSGFRSSHIIDATGKSAFLSQHLQLPIEESKLDPRVAYFSHFELPTVIQKEMQIIGVTGGYIFLIPVSQHRVSIGAVLAEHTVNPAHSIDEIFEAALSSSPFILHIISSAKKVLPTVPIKNHQRICLEPSNGCFWLVGDAAAFLDPFLCPGIDFAIFSARQAAQSILRSSASDYKKAVMNWLKDRKGNVYQQMEKSHWRDILRLFADPHLPLPIPLMLTQAFGQVIGKGISLKEGIQTARGAYEMAVN